MEQMEEELRFLREKVGKLESTIQILQNDLQDKLSLVLERFFDHRADQIARQRKALEMEEDICLSLLSSCCSSRNETTTTVVYPSEDTQGITVRPQPKPRKRRRSSGSSLIESDKSAEETAAPTRHAKSSSNAGTGPPPLSWDTAGAEFSKPLLVPDSDEEEESISSIERTKKSPRRAFVSRAKYNQSRMGNYEVVIKEEGGEFKNRRYGKYFTIADRPAPGKMRMQCMVPKSSDENDICGCLMVIKTGTYCNLGRHLKGVHNIAPKRIKESQNHNRKGLLKETMIDDFSS